LTARFTGAFYAAATCCKARASIGGKSFPRFSARRRIPRQAVALKKYRRGTLPVSKMSDNEHTPSSLRDSPAKPVHSHVLSVKDSVAPPIPEFSQRPEEGSKVPSAVAGQYARHVLPNHPSGANAFNQPKIDKHEVPARVSQSLSESGDAETLARGASANKVN
jgi:hypothetical protein